VPARDTPSTSFAADLWQVYLGEGSSEYRDPVEFFRRTYITEGLRHLLVGALKRLSFGARDPVSELQTNFGGGKTHSLLAQTCALRSRSTLDAH
jgi:predicted AAA+ superfamily ATPase